MKAGEFALIMSVELFISESNSSANVKINNGTQLCSGSF